MNDKAFVIGVFVVLSAFLIALTVTSVLSAIKKKERNLCFFPLEHSFSCLRVVFGVFDDAAGKR